MPATFCTDNCLPKCCCCSPIPGCVGCLVVGPSRLHSAVLRARLLHSRRFPTFPAACLVPEALGGWRSRPAGVLLWLLSALLSACPECFGDRVGQHLCIALVVCIVGWTVVEVGGAAEAATLAHRACRC